MKDKNLDKIKITSCSVDPNTDHISPADTIIKINDKVIPYIHSFNLRQSVHDLNVPTLTLELAVFEDMFEYEGLANVEVNNLIIDDTLAKKIYEKLKERFENSDNK
jgi:hypothetical protein